MTAAAKPAEGARIRFSTPNLWDDPAFRSAIRGEERARRRAEMQATIDRADAQRAGKIYERNADPIGEAPAPPKKSPELARDPKRPQRLAEPWVCPGCRVPFETANGVRAHKANCVGLYERRKAGASTTTPSKPGPAYTCKVCGAGFASMAAVIRHRDEAHASHEPDPGPAPVAREPIQADTPLEAPACPIGQAQEGEMAKVEEKKGARPCGCGPTGRHRVTCALAAKLVPVFCKCGRDFSSASAMNGHLRSCPKRPSTSQASQPASVARPAPEAPAKATLPRPRTIRCTVGNVSLDLGSLEEAAEFVRLVAGTPGAKTEARA